MRKKPIEKINDLELQLDAANPAKVAMLVKKLIKNKDKFINH